MKNAYFYLQYAVEGSRDRKMYSVYGSRKDFEARRPEYRVTWVKFGKVRSVAYVLDARTVRTVAHAVVTFMLGKYPQIHDSVLDSFVTQGLDEYARHGYVTFEGEKIWGSVQ